MMPVWTPQGLADERERLAKDLDATDFHPWCGAGCVRSTRPCKVPCSFLAEPAVKAP